MMTLKLDFAGESKAEISFFVPGLPAPGGSKRYVGKSKKTGRAILIDDAGARNKNWRTCVAYSGHENAPAQLLRGALSVSFVFFVPRPKGHYRTGKRAAELRPDAPTYPTKKPDVLKLSRSTEDALTNIIWADDAQTVWLTAMKQFGEKPGCQITIVSL